MKTNDLFDAIQSKEIFHDSIVTVDIWNGPISMSGFRSGLWPVSINGIKFMKYSSISSYNELSEQEEQLFYTVKRALEQSIDGETYLCPETGELELKYAPQMTRV